MITVTSRATGSAAIDTLRTDLPNTMTVDDGGVDSLVINTGDTRNAPVFRLHDVSAIGGADWFAAVPPQDPGTGNHPPASITVGPKGATLLGGALDQTDGTWQSAPLTLEANTGAPSAISANPNGSQSVSTDAGSIQYNADSDMFYVCLSDGWHAITVGPLEG